MYSKDASSRWRLHQHFKLHSAQVGCEAQWYQRRRKRRQVHCRHARDAAISQFGMRRCARHHRCDQNGRKRDYNVDVSKYKGSLTCGRWLNLDNQEKAWGKPENKMRHETKLTSLTTWEEWFQISVYSLDARFKSTVTCSNNYTI